MECSRLVKADGAARADDAVRVPAEGRRGRGGLVWKPNSLHLVQYEYYIRETPDEHFYD